MLRLSGVFTARTPKKQFADKLKRSFEELTRRGTDAARRKDPDRIFVPSLAAPRENGPMPIKPISMGMREHHFMAGRVFVETELSEASVYRLARDDRDETIVRLLLTPGAGAVLAKESRKSSLRAVYQEALEDDFVDVWRKRPDHEEWSRHFVGFDQEFGRNRMTVGESIWGVPALFSWSKYAVIKGVIEQVQRKLVPTCVWDTNLKPLQLEQIGRIHNGAQTARH